MKVKALFISDVHLGSRGSNDKKVLELLKEIETEYLFIVGDFIDGWLLQKKHYWPQSHTNLVQKILKLSKKKTKVVYITGNHDEFLRSYVDFDFGNIIIADEFIYEDYLVIHGDKYDGVVKLQWLGKLGASGYELAINVDRWVKKLGVRVSLSKYLKEKVKEAVKFITKFEEELIRQAKIRNCKGVICGHIHKPDDKIVDNIHYLNCGDWIENNSYIVQKETGEIELLCYPKS
jgi:UDP-2,3-diacylglucosamine pyrophosphatase LpxH